MTQMIGFLRKNFPSTVTAETVKKYQLASNNESYVINVLQFLGLIDEQGKRTENGHHVMTLPEEQFQESFAGLVRSAYGDLFDLRGDDAWELSRDQLTGYFRTTDKTSEVIGGRQAGVFVALREVAGFSSAEAQSAKPKTANVSKPKTAKKAKPVLHTVEEKLDNPNHPAVGTKGDIALTVRIEINLPAEGTQETYDAIFKSIKANLYP